MYKERLENREYIQISNYQTLEEILNEFDIDLKIIKEVSNSLCYRLEDTEIIMLDDFDGERIFHMLSKEDNELISLGLVASMFSFYIDNPEYSDCREYDLYWEDDILKIKE